MGFRDDSSLQMMFSQHPQKHGGTQVFTQQATVPERCVLCISDTYAVAEEEAWG